METMESLFSQAIDLRDRGVLNESSLILMQAINEYPDHKDLWKVHTVLGGVCGDMKQAELALNNFTKAIELNPNSELASLGRYVSLVDLGEDIEALSEMKRFLSVHPARLYRDTIVELLDGLQSGFMESHRDEIISLAKKNGM